MINKNQLAGKMGRADNNEKMNGGISGCLRRYNAANVGAAWRTKGKRALDNRYCEIKRKVR